MKRTSLLSSSWSARDRPWPRRRRPTRPWPDPRQVMRRPACATHAAPRRAFRQRLRLCRSPDDAGGGRCAPGLYTRFRGGRKGRVSACERGR
eukprot:scaffold14092_cov122-Isochrysis_galbana.AAC.2